MFYWEWRCGGLVVSVFTTRSARPGFESRPGASPQSGLRGGRTLCEYCTNKIVKTRPRLAISKKIKLQMIFILCINIAFSGNQMLFQFLLGDFSPKLNHNTQVCGQ